MTVVRIADSILLVMLLHHLCCSSLGLVSDGETLLEFKSSVIDRLYSLGSWGPAGADPCDGLGVTPGVSRWTGVTCWNISESASEVYSLELRGLSLASTDVTMLAKLKNLDRLDLRDNSFTGEPPDLSKLETLRFLYLGNNQFQGPLADRFPLDLLEIEVQNNFFTGEIGNTNLFFLSLKSLDLHGNNFTGEIPDLTYPGLEYIAYLDLSGNQFVGPLPPALLSLELVYCNMSGNGFTGNIEVDLTRDSPARILDLSKNKIGGNIPAQLFTSFEWSYLDLSDNQLEGPIPSEVADWMRTEIQFLYLQNNRLTGDFYNLLRSNLSNLVVLRLHGNGRGFNVSGANQSRVLLGGSFSWFDDKVYRTLFLSARCYPQFESLDFLNHTEASPFSAVNRSINLPRLRILELSDCDLEGNIPSDIFNPQALPSLQVLDLSGNSLNGRIPAGLRQMPQLRELRLGRNLLSGHIENWVDSNWTNLEALDISDNCVWFNTSEPIEAMLKYPDLKELRLGSNSVVRGILLPTVNGSLEAIELLDLSDLQLNGNISLPYSSPNFFPSLIHLDLSENVMSGPIPEGFGNMPRLTHLNLSHNSLSGEIPLLPPVLVNRESFLGNDGLCGPPLEYCPVPTQSLALWKILLIVAVAVVSSGGSCLFLGWIWRRRTDAKQHKQDAELIAALLDRDTTTLMPLRDLRKATHDFAEVNQIGVGGFGTVYRGVLEDGTVVAIKKSKRDGSTSEDKCQFLNEVKILSQVHHRNLVRLLGCCLANKNALLVLEFVPNGTLQEHLLSKHGHTPLSWDQRLTIAIQTSSALDYLHSSANPPIYHLDVKSANILLDTNLNGKVADFGISKLAPAVDATHITTMHGFQGTFGYMDPEMVVKSMLSGKSDVYAFGVVLLELITAKAVVDRSRGEDISLVKWAGRMIQTGSLEEVVDPVILDTFHTSDGRESIDAVARLAMDCLMFRSEDRPTMKAATRDLLCIQQRIAPPNFKSWTTTTRNEETVIELSSFKGNTI